MKAWNEQTVLNLKKAPLTMMFENTQRGSMAGGQPALHDSVRQALLGLFPELELDLAVEHFLKRGGEPLLTLSSREIERLFIDRLISRLNDDTPLTSRKQQLLPQMREFLQSRYPTPAQVTPHAKR